MHKAPNQYELIFEIKQHVNGLYRLLLCVFLWLLHVTVQIDLAFLIWRAAGRFCFSDVKRWRSIVLLDRSLMISFGNCFLPFILVIMVFGLWKKIEWLFWFFCTGSYPLVSVFLRILIGCSRSLGFSGCPSIYCLARRDDVMWFTSRCRIKI